MDSHDRDIEEESARVDVKSRIAAFSQGSTAPRPAPAPVVRVAKPTLRKTPSTSQLLPAWQQQQKQKNEEQSTPSASGSEKELIANRPRASTSDNVRLKGNEDRSRGNSPKIGVKNIIALYGQQRGPSNGPATSQEDSLGKEPSFDNEDSKPDRLISRVIPPPALPPRPKTSGALLSQSNTGSSSHSSSSNGVTASTSPSSTYTPYLRRGSHLLAASGAGSPALPPRSWQAKSSEDLTLDPSHSSLPPASTMRSIGSGPKWASSSSGNLTMEGENGSTPPPPAVPPRSIMGGMNGSSSSLAPPPPKRSTPAHSPPTSRSSRPSISSASNVPIPAASSSTSELYLPRSKKSFPSLPKANSSTAIAPPPRHVDARRKGLRTNISTSSNSSLRGAKLQRRKDKRQQQRAGAVYTREPGEAEHRYSSLFDRLLKEQEARKGGISSEMLLNKRTVVRIWKQSRLEDWYLAKVWDAATQVETNGVGKPSFVKAMSAIDYELSRRQEEREARSHS